MADSIKLAALNPQWIKWQQIGFGQVHSPVGHAQDATGIRLVCPVCRDHQVVCWTPAVPPQVQPPGRWRFEGQHYTNLTLSAAPGGSDCVHLVGGCGARFYIRNGEVTDA